MAVQIPTSNFWADRNGHKALYVIVHGTAGGTSPYDVAHQFVNSQGTSNPKSTHYIIGQDGTVVQCVQEKDAAWGNGVPETGCDPWWNDGVNPNLTTISIEHVKNDTTNMVPLTDAQKNASFQLIKDICNRWGIPKRKADRYGGITGHFSISPVDRAHCPGTYPWQDLFNFLAQNGEDMLQITDPYAAAHFSQASNDRWHCKDTNLDVSYGILGGYRAMNGAPRLPLGPEQYDIPQVVYQRFEAGVMVYDPQHKLDAPNDFGACYLLKLDSPLAQKLLGAADATELADLQKQLAQATAAAAQAISQKNAAEAAAAALQKEVDALKAQPQVDKAAVSADITSAEAALQNALTKLK